LTCIETSSTPRVLVAAQQAKYAQISVTSTTNVLTENFGRQRFVLSRSLGMGVLYQD
jgi:hypothetical protein